MLNTNVVNAKGNTVAIKRICQPTIRSCWSGRRNAYSTGPHQSALIPAIRQAEHPAQAIRPCLALLGQSKTYGKQRLEAACLRGHLTGAHRLHNIRTMLKNGLEQQAISPSKHDPLQAISHDNVHGEGYFH